MLRERGAEALADRVSAAYEAFLKAHERLEAVNRAWADDIDSAEKGRQVRAASAAADEAEEEHDRVVADVTAFFEKGGE
ncbi:hypothetical protein D3C83_155910 [compost metagenome]